MYICECICICMCMCIVRCIMRSCSRRREREIGSRGLTIHNDCRPRFPLASIINTRLKYHREYYFLKINAQV